MFDFLVRCIYTTRDSRRWIKHQKDPLYKAFSLPLIFVFSFDLSLTAFLPAAATAAGDEADMLVFALAEEEETSITPEGQTGRYRDSLHMASFQGPAVDEPKHWESSFLPAYSS